MAYELKTKQTEIGVEDFIDNVPDPQRREDARKLCATMARLSRHPPKMWGPTIVGFGRYRYTYASGHSGEMARIGFSPRKSELVLYLFDDFSKHQALMDRLGKHKTGKCCLYIKKLADVDEGVLEELIAAAVADMDERYPEGS